MSEKILVVEDDAATRLRVCNALARKGHQVLAAADGHTALELMESEQPRLVLQDLVLPDADGFELVGELRRMARGTHVSILAFSGHVSEFGEERMSKGGFDDVIAKPIGTASLVSRVEAHLPEPIPQDQAAAASAAHPEPEATLEPIVQVWTLSKQLIDQCMERAAVLAHTLDEGL